MATVSKRLHMFLRLAILAAVSSMSSAEDLRTCDNAVAKYLSINRCCRNCMYARRMLGVERCHVCMSQCLSGSIMFPVALISVSDP
jgi:hypothetical protein